MPVSAHYGGKGTKVMQRMKETYGPKKAKRVFYATENKMTSHMPVGARMRGVWGDVGALRGAEARNVGGFTRATTVSAASYFTKGR